MNVNSLIAASEPVADERQQEAIRLIAAIEEDAHMAIFANLSPRRSLVLELVCEVRSPQSSTS
jgi:hypothetical protein